MPDPKPGSLYLGRFIEPAGDKTGDAPVLYEAKDLTTHAVIVGMTGSGKTGLGIVTLEEALLSGVPVLALDPKGDLTNMLLNFPDFRPADFEPWVNPGEADRAGLSVPAFAAQQADTWRQGLAGSGVSPERMRALRDGARLTIYTPGSTSGVPMNIVGSLARPALDWEREAEAIREEIEGFVSSLLGLAGIESDPLSSREHILLANLIEQAWSQGQDLDLPTLLAQVQRPPLRKLGLMDVDVVFPEKDRVALAMRLNGILAAPSFASWMAGPALDVGAMLAPDGGRPRGAIVYLAHLSEAQRHFIVALLLSKVVTWFRGLSGTTDLRALLYMDEVYGFVPPSANPPAKKPILTIFKQARAFGVGMVLSTQNPVDLDYKAISNAGTWLIGRLQTEQDKARLMDGLRAVSGEVDPRLLGDQISGLGKRQFLLHKAGGGEPRLFSTRWAISYLRGPLTKDQITELTRDAPEKLAASRPAALAAAAAAPPSPPPGADETPIAPATAPAVPVYYARAAAPWAAELGAEPGGRRWQAGLLARLHLGYDDAKAGITHRDSWEVLLYPLARHVDPAEARSVTIGPSDLARAAPPSLTYVLPEAPIDKAAFFKELESGLKAQAVRSQVLELPRNRDLKLYGRPEEPAEAFAARCRAAAEAEAATERRAEQAKLETRLDTLREAVRDQRRKVEELERAQSAKSQEVWLGTAGSVLGSLLGSRSQRGRVGGLLRGLNSFTGRQSRASQAGARTEAAKDALAAREQALTEAEAEGAERLAAIDRKWAELAGQVDVMRIPAERSDVTVDELAVVWLPTP